VLKESQVEREPACEDNMTSERTKVPRHDYAYDFIVDRKTLEIVGNIQPPGVIGPGHEIATDSKGNLYIAQTTAGMQKLTLKGMSPASR